MDQTKIRTRGNIKGQLTRLASYIEEIKYEDLTNLSKYKIEARHRVFKGQFDKFEAIQSSIENDLGEKDFEAQKQEREQFEALFYDLDAEFEHLLDRFRTTGNTDPQNNHNTTVNVDTGFKLPNIELPTFSGDITEWASFIELFDALIDAKIDLEDVNKLFYLKSALRGDASKIIESLATTAANYSEARDLLIKRFGNKRCMIQAHLKGLLEQSEVKSKSVSSLRNLLDVTNKHLASLRSLGEPVSSWDTLLVFVISSKLDHESRRQFEMHFPGSNMPTLKNLLDFLNQRCLILERVEPVKNKPLKSFTTTTESKPVKDLPMKTFACYICKGDHKIWKCSTFISLKPEERYDKVRKFNLCANCLAKGHRASDCRAAACSKCSKKHNSLLHFNVSKTETSACPVSNNNSNNTNGEGKADASAPVVGSMQSLNSSVNQVMLFTARVKLLNNHGKFLQCRALLDNGAQSCFISTECASRLGLELKDVEIAVNGIGLSFKPIKKFVDVQLQSNCENFTMPIQALILPKITVDLPQNEINMPHSEILSGLKLADPDCFRPGKIDLLLSNEIFTSILKSGTLNIGHSNLKALNTSFGWIIGGGIKQTFSGMVTTISLNATHDLINLDENIRKFWDFEEMPFARNEEIDPCEGHFVSTFERDEHGKFLIELPFKDCEFNFGHSRKFALSRFHGLEKRFSQNLKLKSMYSDFVFEYLDVNFFEIVPKDEHNKPDCYYLPHHGVLKESSLTTKLRTVFDGTAAPSGCQSINSVLYTGPKQHTDLFVMLLKFRLYAVALIADIERMFCQIKVKPKDRDCLRFFWRFENKSEVDILRLTSLPFGLKCSPFIAIRCLRELANSLMKVYPRASNLILNSFYVDDFIGGADTIDEAIEIINELKTVCNLGGFNLRKWSSNETSVLDSVNSKSENLHSFDVYDCDSKVLGMQWLREADQFTFSYKNLQVDSISKRVILSELARIFDPFGLLSPITVKCKIILQELWLLKLNWDEKIPIKIESEWAKLKQELEGINQIRVDRFAGSKSNAVLCGFSDASEKAYGACVYYVSGNRSILMASRSKVAPLKSTSLARLELCAAVLCAKLMNVVSKSLEISLKQCMFWSDSKIVLAWLSKQSYCWKTFVANRVSEIHTLTPNSKWQYVKSIENPADIVSRGLLPNQLINCKLWWQGPSWLGQCNMEELCSGGFETTLEEKKQKNLCCVSIGIDGSFFERFSSWLRLIHVYCKILRFINNCRLEFSFRTLGPITVEEIDKATLKLVKSIQNKHFVKTIDSLSKKKSLTAADSLISLNPFLDAQNVLRVGGRLVNSLLPYGVKHPIVLPKKDHFVDLLLRYEHFRNNHIGPNGLIAIVRQTYWIINAKTQAKRIVSRCTVCFKHNPKRSKQLLGSLPLERTENVRAFYNIGVDLCGPFHVRPTKRRGNSTQKSYVALFICFAVKAVHLEILFDLTTESFIASLRRFIARRGVPHTIFSDNATNFVGTKNVLCEWYKLLESRDFKDKVYAELLRDKITWKFIPARTPNFGGLWEGNIKSFKTSLYKCMGNERLSFEEFQTLLIQIEGTMNSRPLCTVTECKDDIDVLTPGHFLIGTNLKSLPHPLHKEFCGNLGSRWNHLQQILDHYWRRWSTEFISALNQRNKSCKINENVKIGDLGLLVDENLPPYVWPLCKVVDRITGPDDLVRVIKVKVGSSIFKRGISKFCKLPDFNEVKSGGSMVG